MTVRITVDRSKCQGYGQCVFEAEDLFHLDDEDKSVPVTDADDSHYPDAERAADVCPMQAILVE